MSIESVCHVDTLPKSSYELYVDTLEVFLEGIGGSEEVMSWEGICDDNFGLTHELLQDDEFVQDIDLRDEETMHEEKKVTRESTTPPKVISSELLSIQSANFVPNQNRNKKCFKKKFCKRKKKKRLVRDNSFMSVDLVDDDTTWVKYLESVKLNTFIKRNLFLCIDLEPN